MNRESGAAVAISIATPRRATSRPPPHPSRAARPDRRPRLRPAGAPRCRGEPCATTPAPTRRRRAARPHRPPTRAARAGPSATPRWTPRAPVPRPRGPRPGRARLSPAPRPAVRPPRPPRSSGRRRRSARRASHRPPPRRGSNRPPRQPDRRLRPRLLSVPRPPQQVSGPPAPAGASSGGRVGQPRHLPSGPRLDTVGPAWRRDLADGAEHGRLGSDAGRHAPRDPGASLLSAAGRRPRACRPP